MAEEFLPKKIEQISPHVLRVAGMPDLDDPAFLEAHDKVHKAELTKAMQRLSAFLQSYVSPNTFVCSSRGLRISPDERAVFLDYFQRVEDYERQCMPHGCLDNWRAYMSAKLIGKAYGHESNPGQTTNIKGDVHIYESLPKMFIAKDHPKLNGLDFAVVEFFTGDIMPARTEIAVHDEKTPVFLARDESDVSTMYWQPEVFLNAGFDKPWKQKLDEAWANFEKAK